MLHIQARYRQPRARNNRDFKAIDVLESPRPINGTVLKVRCRHVMAGRSPKIIKITEARKHYFRPNELVCSECSHRPQCAGAAV